MVLGSSINDIMVLRGGSRGFCDKSIKALVIKRVSMGGGGVKICPKLRDVIYGRPHSKGSVDPSGPNLTYLGGFCLAGGLY